MPSRLHISPASNMLCNHTGKPFVLEIAAGSMSLLVLKEQMEDAKAAIIETGVPFAVDRFGTYENGIHFCVVYFRPDVDAKSVEAALAEA